jgi:hypothetical protein
MLSKILPPPRHGLLSPLTLGCAPGAGDDASGGFAERPRQV